MTVYMHSQAQAALLRWIREREKVRKAKEAGLPKPWTSDPIIQSSRFCNVRREDDKVTRWIAEHIRKPLAHSPTLPTALALARHINRIETLENLFDPRDWKDKYEPKRIVDVLGEMKADGRQIYGAAYVMRAESNPAMEWYSWPKHRYIVEIVAGQVWHRRGDLTAWAKYSDGMEKVWTFLNSLYGWGEFMAFQVTVDLRHTPFLEGAADLRSFVAFGPGTRRGLNRMYGRDLSARLSRLILRENLLEVQYFIDEETGIELEPYDVANCMCELDKYMRGGGKQRYPGAK